MSFTRPAPLNIQHARLKQEQSFNNPPDTSPGTGGSLSPNLQPPTPPTFPPVEERHSTRILGKKYLLLDKIDDSSLYKCINVATHKEMVCKVIPRETYPDAVMGHVLLDSNPHINIIEEVIVGETKTYVIFPRSYGDLHSYVRAKRRLREPEAAHLFRQVVSAVAACHEMGVVLRDLKLRKFVFENPERTHLKLETLDDAYITENGDDTMSDKHGCPAYVSPEIISATDCYSGKAADCWSLGVILYAMLVGRYPFHDTDPTALLGKVRRGTYFLPEHLSPKAKCLIRSLLRKDPVERLSAEEALYHPWFKLAVRGGSSGQDSHLHGANGDDAKVPDQTVPDVSMPEDNSSLFT